MQSASFDSIKETIMSHFTGAHLINSFVAGKSEPLSGQRLAKIGYKSSKKQEAKFKSVCVSVPFVSEEMITGNINRLIPYVREMIGSAQDGIIRSLYESSGGLRSSVSDEEISIDSVIGYLEAESTGGRLTKEFLESWFDENMRENLTVVIADKLGFEELNDMQMETIGKHLAGYKGLISSLSGGKTFLQDNQCKGLIKALEVSSVEDDTSKKLVARINGMLNKPKIEELLEL